MPLSKFKTKPAARKALMAPAPKKPLDTSTYAGRFGARIRMLREKSGLSVEEFAAAMSKQGPAVAARTVYHWETARSLPPVNSYPIIAEVLGLKSVRALMPEK